VPIPGTTKLASVSRRTSARRCRASRGRRLRRDRLSAASKIEVQGARYPEQLERLTVSLRRSPSTTRSRYDEAREAPVR
jgi:hypothetical protein